MFYDHFSARSLLAKLGRRRHDRESTQITLLSLLELCITSRASWMARSSAVYMDACPCKRVLMILQFETTAHPTLLSSFEPSSI